MAKEITLGSGNITFLKNKELKEGQTITGKYVGTIEGKFGNAYKIEQADGTVVGVNASGQLRKKMDQVPLQSNVTLTYLGREEMERGDFKGTLAHQFKVVVNDEAPAAPAPAKAAGGSGFPFA